MESISYFVGGVSGKVGWERGRGGGGGKAGRRGGGSRCNAGRIRRFAQ